MENRTEARRRKSESIQTAAFKIKNIVKETSIDIPDNACSLSGAEKLQRVHKDQHSHPLSACRAIVARSFRSVFSEVYLNKLAKKRSFLEALFQMLIFVSKSLFFLASV